MATWWIVTKKHWRIGLISVAAIMCVTAFWRYETNRMQENTAQSQPTEKRVIHMITSEVKGKSEDGKELEVYRFDPGTVPANDGELVELRIRGVNGKQHDFFIEGMDIKGTIYKNKETVVTFVAKEGIYRIICANHADAAHEGPMIGYIVVD
ncbi:transcriptional regulator [Paenibacillus agilis]|uniref:Transcriptional regulator n=1 Tax=Paenibacillus agilis TaxID=3020863 RepID=A0A559IGE7_9BACL|nr:transcriptional regulator [Paenibacillus agilis]TVX86739.1 transcriptional regulator [Paenibacillus agilis]